MDESHSNIKKLSQTRISSFFSGCTKQPSEVVTRKSRGCRRKIFTGMLHFQNSTTKSTSLVSPEYQKLISDIPKRKLPVPIYSDDETSDNESPTKKMNSTVIVEENNTSRTSSIKVLKNIVISPEKEQGKLNYEQVNVMRQFYENTLKQNHFLMLLTDSDKQLLRSFFKMETDLQYICIKLFLWKPSWYNIFQYAAKIKLEIDDKAVLDIYKSLSENGFIKIDYMSESSATLLHILPAKDVKEVAKIFKIREGRTKASLIPKLLQICKTQESVSSRSTESVLKQRIKERLGFCIQLSDNLRRSLFYLYVLNTFTNPRLREPQDYFTNISFFKIVFPVYQVEKFAVFRTPTEFENYADAVKLRCDLDIAVTRKQWPEVYELCRNGYEMLKTSNADIGRFLSLPHLERFTPNAQYCSVIFTGSKYITKKCYEEVATWFEYLLSQDYSKHKRGYWFAHLALIYTIYLKNYERAAKLLIDVFKTEIQDFPDPQIQELVHRAKMLNKKTYNLPQLFRDQFVELAPRSCDRDWPKDVIRRPSVQSADTHRRKQYAHRLPNGDVDYLTVEETALQHYRENGFPKGIHCEGGVISCLFYLLFWDIIYEINVEGTFVSNVQEAPLDMPTKHFYLNRQDLIDLRLSDIRSNWTMCQVIEKIVCNYQVHCHEATLHNLENYTSGGLVDICTCIGREVLSKIFKRLVTNVRVYSSGFPDLIVWNVDEKKAKFVEVKSQTDTLSIKQKLWLNYLIDIGGSVAVCHVVESNTKTKKGSIHVEMFEN